MCGDDEEETQEAPSQLESGHHNGLYKSSNDFVLNTEPAPPYPYPPSVAEAPPVALPYPPQPASNPEQVTRFGSRW